MLRVEAELRAGALGLDVAVEARAGECLALVGPSGAGKSTLLRVAAGLLRPRRGRVTCGEERWLDTGSGVDLPPEHRACGLLFQDLALFPHLSAWRNVAYGLRGGSRADRRARAHELLERYGLAARAEARPHDLSGGERQRVALARALAPRPRVLLLDEPLSALDARTRGDASRELARVMREAAVPAVLVTHDFGEAARLGDRVAVIDAGRIVQEGTASELAAAPRSGFVADLTGAVVISGAARPGPGGLTEVALDGGETLLSTDRAAGPVAATVHPWEISLAAPEAGGGGSAQNRLPAEVVSVTVVGNRARVGLLAAQPLAAEVTEASARSLGLARGMHVTATWKAAATRLVPR